MDYAATGELAFSRVLFFAPVLARLYHVFSVQLIVGLGLVLQGATLLLAAFSTTLWELYSNS